MKRSGKFYRRNEREVMEKLGFNATPNSGSGWITKEDGQNEHCICQLKTTDAEAIKVTLHDIHTLEYNAMVSHKIPVFAIQFLKTNEVFLLIRPEDAQDVAGYIIDPSNIKHNKNTICCPCVNLEPQDHIPSKLITSSDSARKELRDELNNKYKKKGKSAK